MADLYDIDPSASQAVILAGLIHKHREKEPLTGEEQRHLDDWLNENEANKKLFAELLQHDHLAAELETLNKYNEDNAVSAIFAAVGELPLSHSQQIPAFRRTLTAAAILIVLAAGAWF